MAARNRIQSAAIRRADMPIYCSIFSLVLSSALCARASAQEPPPKLQWQTTFPITTELVSVSPAVAVDSLSNSYLAGHSVTIGNRLVCLNPFVNKYDADGTLLWSDRATDGTPCEALYAVAVDTAGFIYAAGAGMDTHGNNPQPLLKKVSPGGQTLWSRLSPTLGLYFSAAVDSAHGFVYALGSFSTGTRWLRYDLNGNFLLSRDVAFNDGSNQDPVALTADALGLSVLTTSVQHPPSGGFIFQTRVTRYNLDGTVAWTNDGLLNPSGGDAPTDMAEDAHGNVIVALNSPVVGTPTFTGFGLVRYDSQGRITLRISDPADAVNTPYANAAGSDAKGDVYGAGTRIPGDSNVGVFLAEKYDASGRALWRVTNPFFGFDAEAQHMALDGANNVYLSGYALELSPTGARLMAALAKYSQQPGEFMFSISSGNEQIGVVGQTLPEPLIGMVVDLSSAPQANVEVDFSISSAPLNASGQFLSVSSAATSADGTASAMFTLGDVPADYQVTATCPNCAPSANSVTFHACGMLHNDNFKQADILWGTESYDHIPPTTIADEGCAITSMAMLSNYYRRTFNLPIPKTDPGSFNQFLLGQGPNGYDNQTGGAYWTAINQYSNNQIVYTGRQQIDDQTTLSNLVATADVELSTGHPVIFYVLVNGFFEHHVLAVGKCGGKYIVSDPISESISPTLFDPSDDRDPLFPLLAIDLFTNVP